MEQVLRRHVSGRLKVAPEHSSANTLKIMRKPSFDHFRSFKEQFDKIDKKFNLNQQLVPYFISSHPGCEEEDMANLAADTKDLGFQLEQVQDFTPTPMTVATVAYYSGYHPYTLKPIRTAKSAKEKKNQHRFFFWYKRENHAWIRDHLTRINRPDLIEILLRPGKVKKQSIINEILTDPDATNPNKKGFKQKKKATATSFSSSGKKGKKPGSKHRSSGGLGNGKAFNPKSKANRKRK